MAFLYIGAGWDAYPLSFGPIVAEHEVFIYVDALPESNYYAKDCNGFKDSNSEASMVAAMLGELKEGAKHQADVEKVAPGTYVFTFADGKRLWYFMNTKDTKMALRPELSQWLPRVSTLYLCGYAPNQSIYVQLPNLRRIFGTIACMEEVPAQHSGKLMPPLLEPISLEIQGRHKQYLVWGCEQPEFVSL